MIHLDRGYFPAIIRRHIVATRESRTETFNKTTVNISPNGEWSPSCGISETDCLRANYRDNSDTSKNLPSLRSWDDPNECLQFRTRSTQRRLTIFNISLEFRRTRKVTTFGRWQKLPFRTFAQQLTSYLIKGAFRSNGLANRKHMAAQKLSIRR